MPGWFDFINGQTLPASRVQDYLMDQSVMKFADSGSRAAALPFPTDGMVSYLTDIDRLFVYRSSSSAWVQIAESTNLAALSAVLPTRRNAIINGGMDVWQRGTTFTGSNVYTADRWTSFIPTGGCTYTRETTIVPTAFAASIKLTQSGATGSPYIMQSIETANTIPLAGKTVTISAFVYGGVSTSFTLSLSHSATVDRTPVSPFDGSVATSTATVGATWTRITATGTVPTTAKTLRLDLFANSLGVGQSVYFTGVQVEEGSVATPFVRAAETFQGELAACQRYYQRFVSGVAYGWFRTSGGTLSSTVIYGETPAIVTMRANPTSIDYSSNLRLINFSESSIQNVTSIGLNSSGRDSFSTSINVASGLVASTAYRLQSDNNANAFIGFSAEL
jgi:hypothetical protein